MDKNYVVEDLQKSAKNSWVRKSQIHKLQHLRKVRKSKKLSLFNCGVEICGTFDNRYPAVTTFKVFNWIEDIYSMFSRVYMGNISGNPLLSAFASFLRKIC